MELLKEIASQSSESVLVFICETSKLYEEFTRAMVVISNVTDRDDALNRSRYVAVAETGHFCRVMMLYCTAKSMLCLHLLTCRHLVGVYYRPVVSFPGFNAPTLSALRPVFVETSDAFLSKTQPTPTYPALSGCPPSSFNVNLQHTQLLELCGLSGLHTQKE